MHTMLNLHLMKQKKGKFNENIKAKIADCTLQTRTICLTVLNAISLNRLNAPILNKPNKNSLWRWLLAVLHLYIVQIPDFRQGQNFKMENHAIHQLICLTKLKNEFYFEMFSKATDITDTRSA